jgi:hypothetical protein
MAYCRTQQDVAEITAPIYTLAAVGILPAPMPVAKISGYNLAYPNPGRQVDNPLAHDAARPGQPTVNNWKESNLAVPG